MPSQPSPQSPSPGHAGTGGGGKASHPAAARHETSFDIADEDVDWQYCDQCKGLFEPHEYDEHFDRRDFSCVRDDE